MYHRKQRHRQMPGSQMYWGIMHQVAWPCFAISSPQFVQSLQDPNRAFLPPNNSVTIKAKISDLQRTRGCWNVQKGRSCAMLCLFWYTFNVDLHFLESFKLTNPTRNGNVTKSTNQNWKWSREYIISTTTGVFEIKILPYHHDSPCFFLGTSSFPGFLFLQAHELARATFYAQLSASRPWFFDKKHFEQIVCFFCLLSKKRCWFTCVFFAIGVFEVFENFVAPICYNLFCCHWLQALDAQKYVWQCMCASIHMHVWMHRYIEF